MTDPSHDLLVRLIDVVRANGQSVERTVRELANQVSENRRDIEELRRAQESTAVKVAQVDENSERVLQMLEENRSMLNDLKARDADQVGNKLPQPVIITIVTAVFIATLFLMVLASRLLIPGSEPMNPADIPLPPGWGGEAEEE